MAVQETVYVTPITETVSERIVVTEVVPTTVEHIVASPVTEKISGSVVTETVSAFGPRVIEIYYQATMPAQGSTAWYWFETTPDGTALTGNEWAYWP